MLARYGRLVLERFEERGIVIPPKNRLVRAIELTEQVIERFERGKPLRPDDTDLLAKSAEALRTIWEAVFAMHAIAHRPYGSKALQNDLLASFLSGGDVPVSGEDPLPRNTQFEVFTAARLIHSGLTVTRGEPDFRMQFFDETVGIACKRLTSVKATKVYDRLREASNQLRKAKLRGFVSMSLDNWIEDLGDDRSPSAVGTMFDEQLAEAKHQIDRLSERPVLMGVLVCGNLIRWQFTEELPHLEWSAPEKTIGWADDPSDEKRFNEFFEAAGGRLRQSLSAVGALLD